MNLSRRDLRYVELARLQALGSNCKWRVGAVLVVGGRVVAANCNKVRHDGRFIQVYTRHAEIATLEAAGSTEGGVLYCVRVGRSGEMRMSRPCPTCALALASYSVSRVVWSDHDSLKTMRIRDLLTEASDERELCSARM